MVQQNRVAVSVVVLVLGIVLFGWPSLTLKIVCKTVGIALLLVAASNLRCYKKEQDINGTQMDGMLHLVIGIAAGIGGLFFLTKGESLIALLPTVAGIAIMINGFLNIRRALKTKETEPDKWMKPMIMACAALVLGFVIFSNPFKTASLLVKVLGGVLIYNGLTNILTSVSFGERF